MKVFNTGIDGTNLSNIYFIFVILFLQQGNYTLFIYNNIIIIMVFTNLIFRRDRYILTKKTAISVW